jgi:hypothetical protein
VAGSWADDGPLSGRTATWREHQPSGPGDLPRARRGGRNQDKTVGVQQPQRLRHEIGALMPRRGAPSGDVTGADGLSVVLVLGVSQRSEHDSLLGSHRQRNLASAVQRDLGARAVSALDVDPSNGARRRSVNDDLVGMLDDVLAPDVISTHPGDADDQHVIALEVRDV